MISPLPAMVPMNRAASWLLFTTGIALVVLGLSAALGFTVGGVLASIAAVAALLYAGSVWLGDRPVAAPSVIVFDRQLRITGGPHAGEPIAAQFPAAIRAEIERRCHAAVTGQHSRFACRDGARERIFDAAPVLSDRPADITGVLVEGAATTTAAIPYDASVGVI